MNVFTFTGHLGKDAEQRFTQGGDSIVTFSVAVKAGFGDKAKTTWLRCSIWGKRGESVLPYLKKGQQVGVSGEFSMNDWTDAEGQKRSAPEVRVNDVTLLGGKPSENNQASAEGRTQPADRNRQKNVQGAQGGAFADMEDDIPFAPHGAGRAWSVI